MSFVFVIDHHKQPRGLVHPVAARRLLRERKGAVWRRQGETVWRARGGALEWQLHRFQAAGTVQELHYRFFRTIHKGDGYSYTEGGIPPHG